MIVDTHLHTWVKRDNENKVLVQGNNTIAETRLEAPTSRLEVQCAKHYTTTPPLRTRLE